MLTFELFILLHIFLFEFDYNISLLDIELLLIKFTV